MQHVLNRSFGTDYQVANYNNCQVPLNSVHTTTLGAQTVTVKNVLYLAVAN